MAKTAFEKHYLDYLRRKGLSEAEIEKQQKYMEEQNIRIAAIKKECGIFKEDLKLL